MPNDFQPPSVSLISPSLNAGVVENATGDAVLEQAFYAIGKARESAESAINTVHAVFGDETLNTAQRHLRARDVSHKIFAQGVDSLQFANEKLNAGITSLQQKLSAPPAPVAGLAAEIRTALARMTTKDRSAALTKAIADGEDEIVGAVLRAPSLLSGLSKIEREHLASQWAAKRFPAEVKRLANLEKALEHVTRAGAITIGLNSKCYSHEIVTRAEASAKAANAALAKATNQ